MNTRHITIVVLGCMATSWGCADPTDTVAAQVASIRIQAEQLVFRTLGRTAVLVAEAVDQAGRPVNGVAATWSSSDTSVVRVNGGGTVTAVGNGTADISARIRNVFAIAAVEVRQLAVEAIIQPHVVVLEALGASSDLSLTAADSGGAPIVGVIATWTSSDTSTVQVTQLGTVTAQAEGEARITATLDGRVATATVLVEQTAHSIRIEPAADTIRSFSDWIQFNAVAVDLLGHPVSGQSFTWISSDTAVATVSPQGLAIPKRNGTVRITASTGSISGESTLVIDVRGAIAVQLATVGPGRDLDGVTVHVGDTAIRVVGDTVLVLGGYQSGPQPITVLGASYHCLPIPHIGSVAVEPGDTVVFEVRIRCMGDFAYLAPGGSLRYVGEYGDERVLVADSVEGPWFRWSPDGTKLAYSRTVNGNVDLYVVGLDGSAPVRLTNHPDRDYSPSWSPDGTAITYYNAKPDGSGRLMVMKVSGAETQELLAFSAGVIIPWSQGPVWSPTEDLIAFSAREAPFRPLHIWTIQPDGTSRTRVTSDHNSNGISPQWSPDGTRIAFIATDASATTTRHVAVDGSGEIVILDWPTNPMYSVWSPDGRWLAVSMPQKGIDRVNRDGTGRIAVAEGYFFAIEPAFSFDSQHMFFTGASGGSIRIVGADADGSNPLVLNSGHSMMSVAPRPR